MDSSFFFIIVAVAIGLLTFLRKLRIHQDNQEESSSSSSSSSSPPSSLSLSSVTPPSSSSRICTYHVFPSFRGEDVRRDFLSHIQMEFQRMGITSFVDNEIKRGESIGPELIRAIRDSRIAVVLVSRNYASSKWCLDELVEIIKCREELGQTVVAIFYKVDPSEVKKLSGDFGKVFRKTCAGQTKEDIGRWREALAQVATIAGYHSSNWDNEAAMIKKIATDISNMLNNVISSSDFDGLIGMRAHLKKMEPLLSLHSDEVRMIGIWGPPGIGKTTIARVLYNQLSNNFQLSVFMDNINANYTRLCSDDYSTKLRLQQLFMSQITNHKDMEITHLGFAPARLKDKKVLVVLDGVDKSIQLEAMAKETWWFGPGSRIIITTQDCRLFRAHEINHIYQVDFPPANDALQIFCMYAFGQKSPKDGFEELAWEVTKFAGRLPLGLRVMGSHFRGMSKQEWIDSLPRLRSTLDTDIRSILKFSYDALDDEDKDLFLHIACFFNYGLIKKVEELLATKFFEVRQRLNVLSQKSLILFNQCGRTEMHSLLERLGRDIVRKLSINEPGERQFLVDGREICDVLIGDGAGSKSVIGIDFDYRGIGEELNISERAFEGMCNLQFLRIDGNCDTLQLSQGLNYLSRKLRILHWSYFPMTCLPSIVNVEFLIELTMDNSKLEMLWEGIKPLRNLKRMNLRESENLKELPDFSTAASLQKLNLSYCSSLMKLPSSLGKATNLKKLNLGGCSDIVEFPSFIEKTTNLEILDLSSCSNLVELPLFIEKLQKLQKLMLDGCSMLEVLPTNINLESLVELDLTDCSVLKYFPEISTNIRVLKLSETAIEEVPPSITLWPHLDELHMSYFENLKELPHALDSITDLYLSDTEVQEVPPLVKRISRLDRLVLKGCRKLVSLPQIPESLSMIDAEDCESLERLDCFFHSPKICLKFAKCYKLNQEARDLIIKTPTSGHAFLPGGEVPSYFTHRATSGGLLTIKLKERPLPTSMRFKAILSVHQSDDGKKYPSSVVAFWCKNSWHVMNPTLAEHLYTFEVDTEVTSSEIVLEFNLDSSDWKIRECRVYQIMEVPSC
ncbi:PREDICTED: probable disease resistance protein RPP1 [Camelina sativa]|uniref:ADP-ribosyl cyclase/cyclic ADP-ribose hydrolase n=1 Tax=Camelina sativa TaxID=90675 RepID=A0ABM0T1X0_CAMSA|nr:PREDICTED: probable disease resistance protein RPP1 [Camelina sativa]